MIIYQVCTLSWFMDDLVSSQWWQGSFSTRELAEECAQKHRSQLTPGDSIHIGTIELDNPSTVKWELVYKARELHE